MIVLQTSVAIICPEQEWLWTNRRRYFIHNNDNIAAIHSTTVIEFWSICKLLTISSRVQYLWWLGTWIPFQDLYFYLYIFNSVPKKFIMHHWVPFINTYEVVIIIWSMVMPYIIQQMWMNAHNLNRSCINTNFTPLIRSIITFRL